MNKPKENKHVASENRVVVSRGEGLGGRVKWVKRIHCMVTDRN